MKRSARIAYVLYAICATAAAIIAIVVFLRFATGATWAPVQISGYPMPIAVPEPSRGLPGPSRTVTLKGIQLNVSIADTETTREKGLGGRAGLSKDEGMLFVFDHDEQWSFWMKNMRFSIDMVWLSEEGSVVYMAQNVSPESYPSVFTPPRPARYVLELPAGWAGAHHVLIGDVAQL